MPAKKSAPKQITLNDEQLEVVNADKGAFAVYAGPGSGKSACVVSRFARLVKDGVSPDSVISLSFTRTAATNLTDRVESLVGPIPTTRIAGARTYHGLSLAFAQEERDAYPFTLAEFPLATEPIANKLAAAAARRYEVDPRNLRTLTSIWRRKRLHPASLVKEFEGKLDAKSLKLALAYKSYDSKLREEGLLDFDSMTFYMVDILSKNKEVRSRWQYQYCMADEAQDNCITDWELLKLITQEHGNLLCVGDPGQSVFGFRGASPDLFLKMEEMFPGTKKLFLATNYRSTKSLVEFLKEIGPVRELAEKFVTPNELGIKPEVRGFTSPGAEAAWVVNSIKESL